MLEKLFKLSIGVAAVMTTFSMSHAQLCADGAPHNTIVVCRACQGSLYIPRCSGGGVRACVYDAIDDCGDGANPCHLLEASSNCFPYYIKQSPKEFAVSLPSPLLNLGIGSHNTAGAQCADMTRFMAWLSLHSNHQNGSFEHSGL